MSDSGAGEAGEQRDRVVQEYLAYRRNSRRGESGTAKPVTNRKRIDDATVDGHMHIMSGFCAPLRASPGTILGRDTSRQLGIALSLVPGALGGVSRLAKLAAQPTRSIAASSLWRARHIRRDRSRLQLLPMIALPMDMDFAHIDGYRYQEAYERSHVSLESQYWLLYSRVFFTLICAMDCQKRFVRFAQNLGLFLLGADIRGSDNAPYEWIAAIALDLACDEGDIDREQARWLVEPVRKAAVLVDKLVAVAGGDLSAATAESAKIALGEKALPAIDADDPADSSPGSVPGNGQSTFRATASATRPHGGYTDVLYAYRKPRSWDDKHAELTELSTAQSSEYETWWEQVEAHTACAAEYPWRIIPMYHYDPRRYHTDPAKPFYWLVHAFDSPECTDSTVRMDRDLGEAFGGLLLDSRPYQPAPPLGRGPFVGFKMYPPLGYRPCDFTRLPHLKHFYKACEKLNVPVLAHCNPGGFKIRERRLFLDYDKAMQEAQGTGDPFMASQRLGDSESNMVAAGRMFEDYTKRMGYATGRRVSARRGRARYFGDEYVSPEGWAKVLKEVPDLRLCLAHFGSNETPTRRLVSAAMRVGHIKNDVLPSLRDEIAAIEGSPANERTPEERSRLKELRQEADYYECLVRAMQRRVQRKAARRTKRNGRRDIPPPPNSGWEYPITEDWVEKSRQSLGLSDEAATLWRRFPLWNRQIIALICTRPNVYTDISYFFLADRQFDRARMALREKHQARFRSFYRNFRQALGLCAKLRRRVLFGTDWYMNLNDNYTMREYYSNVDDVLNMLAADLEDQLSGSAPGEPHLHTLLTVVNPLRFYRIAEIRETYTNVLAERLGAPADKLAQEDEKIAKLCECADAIDPDNEQSSTYCDPCDGCQWRENNKCSLVDTMGFDENGCYKYPEMSHERIATAGR